MRIYELTYIVDPRQSDEEVAQLTAEYRKMIEAGGGEIAKQESWGRRKLAYPIKKLSEGKYVLLYISVDGDANPLPEVERRLSQNDKVLRYLTVRTDREVPGGDDEAPEGSDDDAGTEEE